MTELKQDLALAVRRLSRAPQLAALVIATLAVGIGLTTCVFAIVEAVVLRPLPFHDPDRLVLPWIRNRDKVFTGLSYPDFLTARAQNHTFETLAFFHRDRFLLRGKEGVERIPGASVSAEFFPTLGLDPVVGRHLSPAEADPPGAPVVLLGYELWQRRFGGDPRAVGQTIELNQLPLTIVGVMPPGFHGFDEPAEIFVPVAILERLRPDLRQLGLLEDRSVAWGSQVGRLAPGVSLEEARADLRSLAPDVPLQLSDARTILQRALRPQLLRLLGAASLVLLISCANVGHLLLTRAAGRHRETAIRAALGATRGQLVRHGLLEGLLLGGTGGIAGLLLAAWSLDLLLAVVPLDIPAALEVRIDGPVAAFALALSLLAGGMSALAPALHSAWPDLAGSLKQGGRGASESPASRRTRSLLVVADVALALMLLIGAGLMIRSLERIRSFDPGFRVQSVLTVGFEPPLSANGEERVRIKQEILRRIALLPGVRSAALTSHIYFDRRRRMNSEILSDKIAAGEDASAEICFVSSGFFRTLGIPLASGRDFVAMDHQPAPRVAIVNRSFARAYLPPGNPLGRRIALEGEPAHVYEVIGVVGDVRTVIEPGVPPAEPQVYLPGSGSPAWGFNLLIDTEGDPGALASPVRETILQVSSGTTLRDVAPLGFWVADATSDTRFFTGLMGIFAGTALALAALGIHGLVASLVQRQTRDIAVRRVLGARPGAILRQLLVRGLTPVLAGIALGLAGAVVLARTLSLVLFEVAPLDPATFLAVPLLFAAAALYASLLAAQRALKIEPMAALREDG